MADPIEDCFEVQVQRAFKRLKVTAQPSLPTEDRLTTGGLNCLRRSPFLPHSSCRNGSCCCCQAAGLTPQHRQLGHRSRAIAREPEHCCCGHHRQRHSSCPERVDSRSPTVGEQAEELGLIEGLPLSPAGPESPMGRLVAAGSDDQLASRLSPQSLTQSSPTSNAGAAGEDLDALDREGFSEQKRGLKRHTTTTCSDEARLDSDFTQEMSVDELAGYFDEQVHIPRKMSFAAELMYT